ncbi:UDP-N-acetylmuramoyl-L-alanyl-D-glutamate--2,6-diaminopimelate ligase [Phascolarctobacterium sp.]|uniref:UDP-N-acetylmuramoyl-L-alanyl-D-glutamate--2, 6-diaminopimelate ligase n=1 Tax=Phascolarctobacterium sp. TaxID=2049039 RepID=UPI0038674F88
MEKQLASLLQLLPQATVVGRTDKTITDITADSRTVQPGSLFICLKGATVDGHKFLPMAAAQGAVAAIVVDLPEAAPEGVTLIKVADSREAMELVTPFFFDYPGKKLLMIGVTGTNGKTTTTNIIRLILRQAGYKVGLIGTINIMIDDQVTESHNTTPDVVDLQKALYAMVCAGCQYCVMEVSSHALALKRVAGIEYDCAVLTNITQDHLDYHKTMENYRDAKSLLFEHLTDGSKENKNAVFNMDDASSAIIKARTKANVLTYGKGHDNDIYPLSFTVAPKHMQLKLHTPVGEMDLELKITGEFNVYNVMGTVAAMLAEKIDKETICAVLDGFDGVPGRFQLVEAGQPYTVIVDYAHTPDGLENVLHTARSITKGKLWVVFGCGGDRDNKKRPIMGNLALQLADKIVVTSDNPRTEDPELIIDEIFTGMTEVPAGKEVFRLSDRRDAIHFALAKAEPADVILIAGKGHENYQILKDKTIHFDDKEVVQEYWSDKK